MVDFNFKKLPLNGGSPREVSSAVNLLLDGKHNAKGSVTLTASTTTTTVNDLRVGEDSVILFVPITANASAELGAGGMFLSNIANNSFTITHANNSQTDRTFLFTVNG